VPDDDPVRRWLAVDPAAGPAPVEISTVDQFQRYSAAEILRTDDPTRAAVPQLRFTPRLALESPRHAGLPHRGLHPDLLPYYVLWGDAFDAQGLIGRGADRADIPSADRLAYGPSSARQEVLRRAEVLGAALRDAPPPGAPQLG
jgi:hypothetical protein